MKEPKRLDNFIDDRQGVYIETNDGYDLRLNKDELFDYMMETSTAVYFYSKLGLIIPLAGEFREWYV